MIDFSKKQMQTFGIDKKEKENEKLFVFFVLPFFQKRQ